MKKTVIFLLAIALMLSLCSCGVESGVVANTENIFNESNMVENSENILNSEQKENNVDPVFLIAHSEGNSSDIFKNFANSMEYGLNLPSQHIPLQNVKAMRKHPFNEEKQLSYSYSTVTQKNNTSTDAGVYYSTYDYYKSGDERIDFLHDSDLVCGYFRPYNPNEYENYPLMCEDAVKEISDAFLLSILPETTLSNFVYEGMVDDPFGRYCLRYQRYVCGYDTDECIGVWIGRSGEIFAYHGYNVKKYDTLTSRISESKIKSAEDTLLSELKSLNLTDFKVGKIELTTNSDGVIFLSIYFSHNQRGMTVGETAYLKID